MSRLICWPRSLREVSQDVAADLRAWLFDGDDDFDLDRYPVGQRAHADRRAGVPAALTEHLDKEVRTAVDDFGVILEIGSGIDHAQHFDDILHPAEIAIQRVLYRRDQHQTHATGMLISFLDRHAGAEFAFGHPAVRPARWPLAREVEQIADPLGVNVVSERTAH